MSHAFDNLDDLPRNRSVATAIGSDRYFTGRPCKNGHLAARATKSRVCLECRRLRDLHRSRIKRFDPVYAAAERERNRIHAATKRATDPNWVERHNSINRDYAVKRRRTDEEFRIEDNRKQAERRKTPEFQEYMKAYLAAYRDANPEQFRAYSENSRARRKAAEGRYTAEDLSAIHKAQDFKCAACGIDTSASFHVDHIMPIIRGGSNWPANIQILCPFCNLSKGAKTMEEFMAYRAANDNRKTDAVAA